MEEIFKDILSDVETEKVAQFNDDPVMKEAIRKVLLAGVYHNGVIEKGEKHDPSRNAALTMAFRAINQGLPVSNQDLGENVRAIAQGVKQIEVAFGQIEKIRPSTSTAPKKKTNRGL